MLKFTRDQSGNHVVPIFVVSVEERILQFIVNVLQVQAVQLVGYSYPFYIFQLTLFHGAVEQKAPIMMELMISIADLVKDQYGNYEMYQLDEHGKEEERGSIMELVRVQVC